MRPISALPACRRSRPAWSPKAWTSSSACDPRISCSSSSSAAGEFRRALFLESHHPFAEILAFCRFALQIAFQIELLLEGIAGRRIDRALGQPQRSGCLSGQLPGQRVGFVHEPVVVDAFPDHSPLLRLFGADFFRKHRGSHCARGADQARQRVCASRIGLIPDAGGTYTLRSEEHTSELQSHSDLVCRLLLEKKKKRTNHQRDVEHK